MSVVTVDGANGAAGQNGVNPGESGTTGGAGQSATALNISSPDSSNTADAAGGNGGAGGVGAPGTTGGGGYTGPGGNGGAAGAAGNAVAVATTTANVAGQTDSATAQANGGAGGVGGSYGLGAPNGSGASGANGGTAAASATVSTSVANAPGVVTATVSSYGGSGGVGVGPGTSGGNGGVASVSASAIATGAGTSATASVLQQGGSGGGDGPGAAVYGSPLTAGGPGGNGASSTAVNRVSGSTDGATLQLDETAVGGSAGTDSYNGAAGTAGAGYASLTFDDTKNATQSADLVVGVTGDGGYGGSSGTGPGSAAGAGTGAANITGAGQLTVSVDAGGPISYPSNEETGGNGGGYTFSYGIGSGYSITDIEAGAGGAGGSSVASAVGVTNGTAANDSVTVFSTAHSGNGGAASGDGTYNSQTGVGSGGGDGKVGGAGGAVKATATGRSAGASSVTVAATEYAGSGGFGSNAANGGAGAAATMNQAVTGSTNGGSLELEETADAGDGGSAAALSATYGGATGAAGAGGAATATLTFEDLTQNSTFSKSVNTEIVANGGSGGSSNYYGGVNSTVGGAAGAAVAISNVTATRLINSNAQATGGAGGVAGFGAGAVGATAVASATATSTQSQTNDTVRAYASAVGGQGGAAYGAGMAAGAGGAASAKAAATSSAAGSVAVYAVQTGGSGGAGNSGANGGAGRASTLTTNATTQAVTGSTVGGSLYLEQDAYGGAGGNSTGGVAGAAGAATSTLAFTDSANTETSLSANVSAHGGGGGSAGEGATTTAGANGAGALASSSITGADAVSSTAAAGGGAGGNAWPGSTVAAGNGGAAVATATGTSTGALAVNSVDAQANANGGIGGSYGVTGGVGGAASATATAENVTSGGSEAEARASGGGGETNAAGGAATATSDATGSSLYSYADAAGGTGAGAGLGGAAHAIAEASGSAGATVLATTSSNAAATNIVTGLQSSANLTSSGYYALGQAESQSSTVFGGNAPAYVTNVQAEAALVASPVASAGNAALAANSNIQAVFFASPTYFALGELGGSYSAGGTGSEVSTTELVFTINEADLGSAGDLVLGLYNGHETNPSGVTGVSLTVTGNGVNLLSAPVNSVAQFTNDGLVLTPVSTSGTLQIGVTLTVDTDAAGAGFFADLLFAETSPSVDIWTGGAGDGRWLTAGNWSLGVPAAGESVDIGSAQSHPVVNINNEDTVDLYGSLANFGTVSLNPAVNYTPSYAQIVVDGNDSLTGGGTILLDDNINAEIYSYSAYTLDNVNNTIEGGGQIFSNGVLTVINGAAGTIDATESDVTLNLSQINLTNNGLVEATGAAGVTLTTTTMDQSGGGRVYANGGDVYLSNSDIIGGKLSSAAGYAIESVNGGELDGSGTLPTTITSGSEVEIVDHQELVIAGSIVNDGEILVNSAGNNTDLRIAGATTLTGGGTIQLSDNANNQIYGNDASASLDNVNNTVSGAGTITAGPVTGGDLSVINEAAGVIDANQAAVLEITGAVTNKGVVEATGAGGLNAFNLTLDQSGGGKLLAKGGNVDFNTSDVIGGTLTSSGGGLFVSTGGGELDGSGTLPVTLMSGSEVEILDGQILTITGIIANSGEIFEDSTGDGTSLYVTGSTSLTGNGKILLSDSAQNSISGNSGAATLTNVSETIEGAGQILSNGPLTLVNSSGGTIEALDSNAALSIAATSFTNNGTVEAIQGATLSVAPSLTNISNDAAHSGGSVLAGGNYVVIDPLNGGPGAGSASNIAITEFFNSDQAYQITTLAAAVTLTGATSTLTSNGVALSSSLLDVASGGSLTVNYSANSNTQQVFDTGANPLEIGGLVTVNGSVLDAASITIDHGGALNLRSLTDAGSALTSGGLSDSGSLTVSSGDQLTVGGALTLASGATLADSGEVTVDGGGSIAAAITGSGTLLLAGGDTTFATGASLSAATWSLSGSGTTATLGATLGYVGGFSAGAGTQLALTSGALTLRGATTLAGVSVSGASPDNLNLYGATSVSGLTIAGDALVANYATATQSGGAITVGDGVSTDKAELYNGAAGVWNIADDSGVAAGADPASLIANYGLFEKTDGSGTSTIATAVLNSGSVLAASGVLDFQGAVSGTGTDTVSGASTLEFDSNVAAGQTIDFTGSGSTLFIGALQTFAATLSGYDVGGAGGTNDVVKLLGSWTETGFSENGADTLGTLTLFNGTVSESLKFAGNYTSGDFNVNQSGGVTIIS